MSLGGVKTMYIAKVFSLHQTTVSRVIRAKGSLEKYHEKVAESDKKYAQNRQKAYIEKIIGDLPMNMKPVCGIDNEKPKTSISDMYGMNRIYEEMKKQTELLERIVALWQS